MITEQMVARGVDALAEAGQKSAYNHVLVRIALTAALVDAVVVPVEDLKEIIGGWADAAQYKGDYLREKHGDDQQIAEYRWKYLGAAAPTSAVTE